MYKYIVLSQLLEILWFLIASRQNVRYKTKKCESQFSAMYITEQLGT